MTEVSDRTQFSVWRALRRHFAESRRTRGTAGALRELAEGVLRGLQEFTPRARRARFGDLDFDFERKSDTTQSNVSLKTQFVAAVLGTPYFASQQYIFDEMMAALPIRFEEFTFIDLGSGKGRTLLMAADRPFKKIIGVELLPELHQSAVQNAAGNPRVDPVCMDVRDFEFPTGPLVVYLFNPFPQSVLEEAMKNLRRSVVSDPREVWVAYRYAVHDAVVLKAGFVKQNQEESWALYKE